MTEEKKTAVKALMLIGTLLSYIKPDESTSSINKLKSNTRKGLQVLYKSDPALYGELSKEADDIWEKAKRAANDTHYTVSLTAMITAIWAALDGNRYQTLWFTEKTFQRAIASMIGVSSRDDDVQIERDSHFLTDIFADGLGIKKESRLSGLVRTEKARKLLKEKEKEMIA